MNGADALIETLIDNDVTACFANPGTSEMQFVSALDRQPKMRPVLCLFEGGATGAADGYGRMTGTPACTLLHLGPGYGNGLANSHNARRAFTPIVHVIGDHATYHRKYDAPLNSNIAAIAGPNSVWVKSAESADEVGPLASEAVTAAYGPPGGTASLILPADTAWTETSVRGIKITRPTAPRVAGDLVDAAAKAIKAAAKPVILIGTTVCTESALAIAGRIAAGGIRVLSDTFIARTPRGVGRFTPDRMVYFGEGALADLEGVDLMVLIGTVPPVAFFAYPDKPSVLVPEGCEVFALSERGQDCEAALADLAEALGAPKAPRVAEFKLPDGMPTGALTAGSAGTCIARHLPEGAIVSDDSVTSGASAVGQTRTTHHHDWLGLTGGAIGQGIPVAIGAAVACPDRKVVSLNGDGAAAYTVQGLWTLARENLDVTVVVFANNAYRILGIEMGRTGSGNPGPSASRLLGLGDPNIDWVSLAKGFGLPAVRCETAESFDAAFAAAMAQKGPTFIEAVVP